MRYNTGDVAFYKPANVDSAPRLLKIGSKRFGWRRGDLLPHLYYSGRLFELIKGEGLLVPNRYSSTFVANVRKRDFSVLDRVMVDISCLVG